MLRNCCPSAISAFLFLVLLQLAIAEQKVLAEWEQQSNATLLWGPYRSNLYFGVRPRLPKSLTTGLLWAKVDNFQGVQQNFRHTCEQHEGMAGYGWDEYDVRTGGFQTIHDEGNSIDVTTEFVKIPGGQNGGSWAVRVKGTPRENGPPRLISTVIFYAGMEGLGTLGVRNEDDELGIEGSLVLEGSSVDLGDFTLEVTEGPDTNKHPPPTHPSYAEKPLDRTIVTSLQAPAEGLWQAKTLMFTKMKEEIDEMVEKYGNENAPPPWATFTIPNEMQDGNLHLIQKVFEGAFEFDIIFSSGSAEAPVTSDSLGSVFAKTQETFAERFPRVFPLKAPFDDKKYLPFAKSMFSNLLGGIGYFYGDELVDRSYAPEYDEENEGFWHETADARNRQGSVKLEGPAELYTCIPSRPFFPRGFLWDEGFHLIPVAEWDMALTLDVVRSWFNRIDEDGWIAREQILGNEARSKVPPEFQVQYPHYANPPTLYLILEILIDKLTVNPPVTTEPLDSIRNVHLQNRDLAISYLRELYPLLKRQYDWFRKTQWGDVKTYDRAAFSSKEAYRWRGRDERHILTSGMDDYPRPQPPHPGELHVDLISWVGLMTRSMKHIADFIQETEDAKRYSVIENAIARNIDDLHWSAKDKTYCDATIDEYEENKLVCHKGYVSIFPFLTGMMFGGVDSPRLKAILDTIENDEELWSEYGIRSLSKSDPNYGTQENYWRSPIWVNINYLVVKNLHDIATTEPPCAHAAQARRIYNRLRRNLVENVYNEWQSTGFAWEQYDPETGKGQRTQHFTGWTSLVVMIMGMENLDDPAAGGREGHGEL